MHIASSLCTLMPCKNLWWSQKTIFVCHSHPHWWFFWGYTCKIWGRATGLKSIWNSDLKKKKKDKNRTHEKRKRKCVGMQFDWPAQTQSLQTPCTSQEEQNATTVSEAGSSPLTLARPLLGSVWILQLWLLEGGWGRSNYAAVKLVWNILTQMHIEAKLTSPSEWFYWGLSRKLLVLMLAYWQRGVEFLLSLLLLLLLVFHCRQTAPKRQVNRHVLYFFRCVQNCCGYEHICNQTERSFISWWLSVTSKYSVQLNAARNYNQDICNCVVSNPH